MINGTKVNHGGDKILKHGTEKDFYSYNEPCYRAVPCKKCGEKMLGKYHVQCELEDSSDITTYHYECWWSVVKGLAA